MSFSVVDISEKEAKHLAKWFAFLDRFPKAAEWNAYRSEGQVFNRGGHDWGDLHGFWSTLEKFSRLGFLVVDDVTDEVKAKDRATYLRLKTTDEGRAALAVLLLQGKL